MWVRSRPTFPEVPNGVAGDAGSTRAVEHRPDRVERRPRRSSPRKPLEPRFLTRNVTFRPA